MVIARGTPGFSGADLANLINEAALFAARYGDKKVDQNHLDLAKDKIMMGPERKSMIMTDDQNNALKIIEQKDASAEEVLIHEVFTGILLINGSLLKASLEEINNQNAANEYYLTDLVEILSLKGVKINCIQANPTEVVGANNKKELHELEAILRNMSAEKLLDQGITLLDASRVDVRGEVVAGKDCSVDVNVIFEGKVSLGKNVIIKSNVVLQDVAIGDNSVIESLTLVLKSI